MTSCMKRILLLIGLVLALSGCTATKVDAEKALDLLGESLVVKENVVGYDAEEGKHKVFSKAGGSILISSNFEDTAADYEVAVDATPFIKAGMIVGVLDSGLYYAPENKIVFRGQLGDQKFTQPQKPDLKVTMKNIAKSVPESVLYSKADKAYYTRVGEHAYLMWTDEKPGTVSKVKLLINPEPLTFANLQVDKLKGWTVTKHKLVGDKGKIIEIQVLERGF